MSKLIPSRKSKRRRVLHAAKKAVKARIAWLAGKKATKFAAPAVALGAVAAVAKKRSGGGSTAAAA